MTGELGRLSPAGRTGLVLVLAIASGLLAGCNETSATDPTAASAWSQPGTLNSATGLGSAGGFGSSAAAGSASAAGTADLSWSAPTTNTDGSPLTDLAGYRIYYGTSPTALNKSVDVPAVSTTNYVISGLPQGTWYFAVEAYTNNGLESSLSQVVDKTIS
jgi:hypothetical protein